MGAKSPLHTSHLSRERTIEAMLSGKRYYVIRIALFALACLLVACAIFILTTSHEQSSKAQSLAASMIKTDTKADVLVIASYDESDPSTCLQCQSIRELLEGSSVGVDVEYLDVDSCGISKNVTAASTSTAGDESAQVEQVDTLAYGQALMNSDWGRAFTRKISAQPNYSLVVCVDDEALCYMEAVHDSAFSQVPVVFMGVSNVAQAQHAFELGYATGLAETADGAGLVSTAVSLCPDATHVVAITDNSVSGRGTYAQFQRSLSSDDKLQSMPVELINSSSLSRNELGEQLSKVGSDAIVVYLSANTDASGNAYSTKETTYYLSDMIDHPIFAVGFGGVGEGFVASNLVDYEQAGKRAGEMAIKILNGTRPADIQFEVTQSNGVVTDAQMLSEQHLSVSALPSSVAVLNRSGVSPDFFRSLFLPVLLLILGAICIIAFAYLGYRRTAHEMTDIVTQRNALEHRFYTDRSTDLPNLQWLTAYAGSDQQVALKSMVEIVLCEKDKEEGPSVASLSDEALRTISERLNKCKKLFLVCPRPGEFILGYDHRLQETSPELESLRRLVDESIPVGKKARAITPRMGVLNRGEGMSIEEMVAGVEIAARLACDPDAKRRVVFYSEETRSAEESRNEILSALKASLADEGVTVLYQPMVKIESSEVLGYDAIVRLRDSDAMPDQFIPVAEANGLLGDLEHIVAKKAIQQLATWKKRKQRIRPITLSYPYSDKCDFDYISLLQALLEKYEIAPRLIHLSIKVELLMHDPKNAIAFLTDLANHGIGITLENFGAQGLEKDSSSVTQGIGETNLPQLAIDAVKIDQTLSGAYLEHQDSNDADSNDSVTSCASKAPAGEEQETSLPASGAFSAGEDELKQKLERIISTAHKVGKLVCIGNVATSEQLQSCYKLGCDIAQGPVYTEPLLPERVLRFKPRHFSIPQCDQQQAATEASSQAEKEDGCGSGAELSAPSSVLSSEKPAAPEDSTSAN